MAESSFERGHTSYEASFEDYEGEGGDDGKRTSHVMLHPDVSRWDSKQVHQWMLDRNLSNFAQTFLENEINGKILLRLNSKILTEELGVPETFEAAILDEISALVNKMSNVESWTEKDVCDWICSFGLGDHVEQFQYHNVTGGLLLQLSNDDLQDDLKIAKFGQRERLLEEIDGLRKASARSRGAGLYTRGGRGKGGGGGGGATSAEELRRLEVQRVQRLRAELDAMRSKVQQLRDAEVRAKTRAMQAEQEARALEQSLKELENKVAGREQAPGAGQSAAKKNVVRGFVDQCTFKPKLNKASLQMMKDKREDGNFLDRVTREDKKRIKERANRVKAMRSEALDPAKQRKLREQCMKFLKDELGFDTSQGVKQEDVERVLDNAAQHKLQVTPEQKNVIKDKLQGFEQFLALFNLFRVRDFVQRQEDIMYRKPATGNKDQQQEEAQKLVAAEAYLVKRFKWTRVTPEQLDNLIDNCAMFELEISEQQLQTFRALKGHTKTRALFKALQTQEFLRRTQVDIEQRERKQEQAIQYLTLAAQGAADADAVHRFLDRYHQDMQHRQERKQKLVEKVQAEDPNFRECTFRPTIVSKHASAKDDFYEDDL